MANPAITQPILVSGAGIAGLTCALSLAAKGFEVEVFEQTEKLEPIGAGIQVSPNAYGILANLGLHDALLKAATFPDFIRIHNGTSGEIITSIPLGKTMKEQFGASYCVIHRGDLQSILLDKCLSNSAIKIRFGSKATNLEEHDGYVLMEVNNEENFVKGHSLVVADGVWSQLRTQALYLPSPVYSGKVALRSLIDGRSVPDPDLLTDTHLWLAPNTHLVTYPVRGGKNLNVILICNRPQQENRAFETEATDREENDLAKIVQSFSNCSAEKLEWSEWPLFETPTPITMGKGRVALIGDAAHAMLPFAAQGAATAIEDAAVLADCFAMQKAEDAIQDFANLRIARVQRIMQLARNNGRIYHINRPLSYVRNIGMRVLPTSRLLSRQSWIYDWKP